MGHEKVYIAKSTIRVDSIYPMAAGHTKATHHGPRPPQQAQDAPSTVYAMLLPINKEAPMRGAPGGIIGLIILVVIIIVVLRLLGIA